MNKNTLKITTGAMLLAIFGMLQFANRQTGGMFDALFLYVLPIPMVAYSVMYGWRPAIPLLIAMGLISFFFGQVTSVFYSVSQALIGLLLGTCLYKRMDTTKTLFVVMAASIISGLFNTLVVAALYGMNLQAEIEELHQMIVTVFEKAGQQIPDNMIEENFLIRLFLVTLVFSGAIQGFIINQLSLVVLKRLKFPVQAPRPLSSYHPPKWTGYVGLAGLFLFLSTAMQPVENTVIQGIYQTVGISSYAYLLIFGWISIKTWLHSHIFRRAGGIAGVLAVFIIMILPQLGFIMGFIYLISSPAAKPEAAA